MNDSKLLEAITYEHAEYMRTIRNSCKEYMTNNNNHISPNEQEEWFHSLDRSKIIPFLFYKNNVPIGYGIIVIKNSNGILTGGILDVYRGYGFGKELFKNLIEKCFELNLKPSLDVFKNNTRAIGLYTSLGFVIKQEFKNIYNMEIL